jgi:lipopolysaccharide/colanic/teichoic acid biosynthesis glycosyltransferase
MRLDPDTLPPDAGAPGARPGSERRRARARTLAIGERALSRAPAALRAVPRPASAETLDRRLRAFQVAVTALLLVPALPLMALCALAVRLSSPGPLLYSQVRVGRDRRAARDAGGRRREDLGGRPFRIYKFRTMVHRPDAPRGQDTTSPRDPRVTAVGRVLRAFRLDELPQLFNVLRGEMNLIGPRPEQPEIFARLRAEVPGFAHRQAVLPGISGLAQIRYGYGAEPEDARIKLRHDLEYLERRSLALDARILLETVPVVLTRRGAR